MTEQNGNQESQDNQTPQITFGISHHPITQQRVLIMTIQDTEGGSATLALSANDAFSLGTQLTAQGNWLFTVAQEQAYQAQQQANPGIVIPGR